MASDLPYVTVPGKIDDLFRKISDAKVPDSFSHAYLRDTLGFKSTNDRPLIGLLKALGMLDQSGSPTPRYRELKNDKSKAFAIGAGIKDAYAPLFEANEKANELAADDLKGLIAQISGTDRDLTSRIYSTLNSLIQGASFDERAEENQEEDESAEDGGDAEVASRAMPKKNKTAERARVSLPEINSGFHFNIQVHLPNNGTEETYLNIFNAIREAFR